MLITSSLYQKPGCDRSVGQSVGWSVLQSVAAAAAVGFLNNEKRKKSGVDARKRNQCDDTARKSTKMT